jgi:hypothetical protein
MTPSKILITIVGVTMIALLLYPPAYNCNSDGLNCISLGSHKTLWGEWFSYSDETKVLVLHKIDLTRLALYELALAGVGALIHFLTSK